MRFIWYSSILETLKLKQSSESADILAPALSFPGRCSAGGGTNVGVRCLEGQQLYVKFVDMGCDMTDFKMQYWAAHLGLMEDGLINGSK